MHWALEPSAQPIPLENVPVALLSGFSVYTTFRLPLADQWLKRHLQRLAANAQTLGLAWPYAEDWLLAQINHCAQPDKPVLRLTAYANIRAYGDFFKPGELQTQLIVSARSAPSAITQPLHLKTVEYERPLATVKLGAIPEPIHFKRQARAEGFDDILFFNRNCHLTEASTANCFLVASDATLLTADPERDGCLPGITRQRVIEAAQAQGISVHSEKPLAHAILPSLTGAFLTNAIQGILPVEKINNVHLPWTSDTQALLAQLKEMIP